MGNKSLLHWFNGLSVNLHQGFIDLLFVTEKILDNYFMQTLNAVVFDNDFDDTGEDAIDWFAGVS